MPNDVPPEERCGAVSKRGRCGNARLPGLARCMVHAGEQAVLVWKSMRYSESLTGRLREVYESAERDIDLLSMRSEVAIMEVRVRELLERLETGEHGEIWKELQQVWISLKSACDEGDMQKTIMYADQVGALIRDGAEREVLWEEIGKAFERKAQVAGKEWKRQVDMKDLISRDRALAFVLRLSESVKKTLPEYLEGDKLQKALAAIGRDLGASVSSLERTLVIDG